MTSDQGSTEDKALDRRTVKARERLLDAAECLIATKGIEALTLSEVQQFAEQRNKSAIAYHFGSREGLIGAVVRRQTDRMDARRNERIGGVEGPLESLSLRELLDILISPIMDGVFDTPNGYEARCLQEFGSRPELVDLMVAAAAESNSAQIRGLLLSKIDHLPPTLRASRIDYAMILVVTLLAQYEACRDLGLPSVLPTGPVRRDLIQVAHAIVSSPASPEDEGSDSWSARYTRTFRFEPPTDD